MKKGTLYILMVFAMIAWGETWVSAKILGRYLDANELIFWRFLFTAFGLYPVLIYLKIGFFISKKDLLISIIAGIILALYNNFFFLGTKFALASFGGVLVTTLVPIVTFVIVSLLNKKSLEKRELIALILGAFGTLTILEVWSFELDTIFAQGTIYFLIATLLWPLLTIISSKQKSSPMIFSFYMFLFASIIDLLFIKFELSNILKFDSIFFINLVLLSLYGTTFATTIYFIAVNDIGSKKASSFFFLVPLSAVVFAYIFLDEKVSLSLVFGGVLTILSVYILNGVKLKTLT